MANWHDVINFIGSNYKYEELTPTLLKLSFSFDDLRTQGVFLEYAKAGDGSEWVLVQSPVGKIGEVDLEKALRFLEGKVVGGLSLVAEEYVTLKDAVPIADLQAAELVDPIRLVIFTADALEKQLSGSDTY